MTSSLIDILPPLAGMLAGGAIGLTFGLIQDGAKRRHQKRQQEGKFESGWAATPGSFSRVAYLLVALALVQFSLPALFTPGAATQWCVSGGVVIGYGFILFRQLRHRPT